MGCINVREGRAIVSIFELNDCGVPLAGSGVGDTSRLTTTNIAEIGWEDQIDEGDQVTERNFGGKKYYSDSGADELEYIQVSLTSGGMIPALDSLLMASDLQVDGSSNAIGFGRTDLDSANAVAIEILIEVDAGDNCTGSDLPVFGILFPKITNWRPSGGATLDGSNLAKPQYQGKCYKSTTLQTNDDVDDSDVNNLMPNELVHWEDIWDPTHWYTTYLFPSSSLPATDLVQADLGGTDDSCELQAVTLQDIVP